MRSASATDLTISWFRALDLVVFLLSRLELSTDRIRAATAGSGEAADSCVEENTLADFIWELQRCLAATDEVAKIVHHCDRVLAIAAAAAKARVEEDGVEGLLDRLQGHKQGHIRYGGRPDDPHRFFTNGEFSTD